MPGIELPEHPISVLRERTLAAAEEFGSDSRVLVYACEQANAEILQDDEARVISMPCVAMLPPAFVDFVISRNLADGVMLAACAAGDCYYRLGDEWTRQRVSGQRDPYLRKRVPRERLSLCWTRATDLRRRRKALADFMSALRDLPRPSANRRSQRD